MKLKYKSYIGLIIICSSFLMPILFNHNIYGESEVGSNFISPSAINRENKVFTNITETQKDCAINNKNPISTNQPKLYLPNNHLSYAKMNFDNITALNHTKDIETQFSDSVQSSKNGSLYIYQKFYVRMPQYVNNVTILIQDVNNKTSFTDENSWEVAIVNCSDDAVGTPNPNKTLGKVQRPHPIKIYPQWVTFDFASQPSGPVFLNINNTKHTYENGIDKYWFAFRVKIPPDDSDNGGGPKFLYFNQDEGGIEDIGEGEIFAQSPEFIFDNYTLNNVNSTNEIKGVLEDGDQNSFIEKDDGDIYTISNESDEITFETHFNLKNLTNYDGSYLDLYWENIFYPFEALFGKGWLFDHYEYIFKIEISLALNVSNPDNIQNANLYAYNYMSKTWIDVSNYFDLRNNNTNLMKYEIRDPTEKFNFLKLIDSSENNNFTLQFQYNVNDSKSFNVSVDQLTIEMGEIDSLSTIQKYDPLIEQIEFPMDIIIDNGSSDIPSESQIDKIKDNDNDYLNVQADSNNLTIEFDFNILPEFNRSLFDVNFYDWLVKYPNPYVPEMDVRISSNVSIESKFDLTHARLEIYRGNMSLGPFDDALNYVYNNSDWFPLNMNDNKTYAYSNEKTIVTQLDCASTWIFLQLLNHSENNLFRMRLRYVGNNSRSFEGFNVSIDEVSLNIKLRNLISSDITSKIGFGVDKDLVQPETIGLKNNGQPVQNAGQNQGYWESEIDDGIPEGGYYEFNVTSLWPLIRFDVNGIYEIYKIKPKIEFLTEFKGEYWSGNELFSVNVSGDNGVPIANLRIYFQILDSNNRIVNEFQAITDENGIASANLNLDGGGVGYSIRVQCAEEDVYTVSDVRSVSFKLNNNLTIFLEIIIYMSPFLVAIMVAGTFMAIVHKKNTQRLREKWGKDAKIIEDLLKLSYIVIIQKESGVPIYSKQVSSERLDTDLISGFLQAISSFKSEFKKKGKSKEMQGFEMNYYDFHINLTDGEYIRVATMAEEKPSQYLKEQQREFTKDFEERFENKILSFRGDLSSFSGVDILVEDYFNISLMYPLQLKPDKDTKTLDRLEMDLLDVAGELEKEKGRFFFSDLLSFGLAGRDVPKNRLISKIIWLKQQNYISRVQMEQ